MVIIQTPSDWQGIIPSVNELYDKQESLQDSLAELMQAHLDLVKRVEYLELKEIRRENLVKARAIKKGVK